MVLPSFVITPLYVYPTGGLWSTMSKALAANPTVRFTTVINPADGPGSGSYPDSNYISAIANINSFANAQTICYVHTTEATRAIDDVLKDIDTCVGWANYTQADIHMNGIFFDEAPTIYSSANADYMRTVSNYARKSLPVGHNTIVFNPGTTCDTGFYGIADYINAFEDQYANYSPLSITKIPAAVRAQTTFMIWGFSGTSDQQTTIVNKLGDANIAGAFISTQINYSTWSNLWNKFCSSMTTAPVGGTASTVSGTVGSVSRRAVFSIGRRAAAALLA